MTDWEEKLQHMYASAAEFYKDMIEENDREIAYLTECLRESRASDRKMVKWVWSRGVVTAWEMEYYSHYESDDTRKYRLEREREYRDRRKNKQMLKYYISRSGGHPDNH